MGINMLTAMTIQGWPDAQSPTEDGMYITTAKNAEGKFAALLYLNKDGGPHALQVSTAPVFASKDEAKNTMRQLVDEVRGMDLSQKR